MVIVTTADQCEQNPGYGMENASGPGHYNDINEVAAKWGFTALTTDFFW